MDEHDQDTTKNHLTTTKDVEWVVSKKSKLLIPQHKNPRKKTFKVPFDWLNLIGVLLIPFVVTVIGLYATQQITQQQAQLSEKQHQTDLQIATDQQREAELETYISNMQDLLLNHHLRESKLGDEVRAVAQARTLTTLSELDSNRKGGALIGFLYESVTIGSAYLDRNYQNVIVQAIISLEGADMSGANLFQANISGANLDFVNLSKANFSFAGWFSPSLNSFIPSGFDGGWTAPM